MSGNSMVLVELVVGSWKESVTGEALPAPGKRGGFGSRVPFLVCLGSIVLRPG